MHFVGVLRALHEQGRAVVRLYLAFLLCNQQWTWCLCVWELWRESYIESLSVILLYLGPGSHDVLSKDVKSANINYFIDI